MVIDGLRRLVEPVQRQGAGLGPVSSDYVRLPTTLTEQEIESAHSEGYDLGPGYPQTQLPDYVVTAYTDPDLQRLSLATAPAWSAKDQVQLDERLARTALNFLGAKPPAVHSIQATFSGGVALDRAITAALSLGPGPSQTTHVITMSPSIDIMRLFLGERYPRIQMHFIEAGGSQFHVLPEWLVVDKLKRVYEANAKASAIVLLTSPENPTGAWWTETQLNTLSRACAERGAILIIDHAFITAGIHDPALIPGIWDCAGRETEWLGIWDTSKTFGLNEDKLGFILSGSPRLTRAVENAIGVMQFDVSRRQKLLFCEILDEGHTRNYKQDLTDICRRNLRTATERTTGTRMTTLGVDAGSLALLRVSPGQGNDTTVRSCLLARGVGVVAASVFFHGARRPTDLLRIALARDPAYFEHAIERMVGADSALS